MTEVEDAPSAPLIRYSPTEATIAQWREQYSGLKADTPEGYEEVRQALSVLRPARTSIEKRRVELKAEALEYGRKVDAAAKRLTGLIEEIEKPLKASKQAVDDEKERIAREKVEAAERERKAKEDAERKAEEARLKAIRDAEEARLAEERKALELEKAKLYAEKLEREKRERAEAAERERVLAAERKALEDERRKIDAERQKAEAEREKLRQEQLAAQREKERLERIAFEKAAREKAEKEAAERVEAQRIERERIAKLEAEAARAEAERIEKARPDVEKVRAFGAVLRGLALPEVKDTTAAVFLGTIQLDLIEVAERLEKFSLQPKTKGRSKVA